jgi:hypothetical protein
MALVHCVDPVEAIPDPPVPRMTMVPTVGKPLDTGEPPVEPAGAVTEEICVSVFAMSEKRPLIVVVALSVEEL